MKALLLFVTVVLSVLTFAQNDNYLSFPTSKKDTIIVVDSLTQKSLDQKGEITIMADSRIDKLVEFIGSTRPPAYGPQISGYRVQVFFDIDKGLVNGARASFLAAYPKEDTYIAFTAPNYTLKVGNFRTKLEAEKLRSEITMSFPAAIVIPEKIYLPKVAE